MKKLSIFLTMSFVVLSFGVFAQLKVDLNGQVGVGGLPSGSYFLQVTGVTGKNGITINTPASGLTYPATYGLFSTITSSTTGSTVNRAVYG